jgi:hypothetical protein
MRKRSASFLLFEALRGGGDMTRAARWLLWVFTMAIPVFIAACYGPPMRYSRSGKVEDASTGQGLQDIDVTCMNGAERGWMSRTYSVAGAFLLYYDTACTSLLVEDALTLDEADGGTATNSSGRAERYKTGTFPFPADTTGDVVVKVEKAQ